MELHFTPEIEKKLNELAAQRGQGVEEFIEEYVRAYVGNLPDVADMLDSRYDDLKSGRVKPISSEEAFARLQAKSELRRKRST